MVFLFFRLAKPGETGERRVEAAFGATLSPREAREIARESLVNLFRSVTEILRFPGLRREKLLHKVSFCGLHHLENGADKDRGTIVLSAHFGNFELLAVALSLAGLPVVGMAHPSPDGATQELLTRLRSCHGNEVVGNDLSGTLRLARVLREGGRVLMLADRHSGAERVLVEFFGQTVSAQSGPALLAQRTGARIVPAFILREAGGRHSIIIEPPLQIAEGRESEEASLTQAYVSIFERYIRLRPEMWVWSHDRWKKVYKRAEGNCSRN